MHQAIRWIGTMLGLLWLQHRLFRVEDGQFEREYSRLYTMIVLGLALLLGGVLLLGVARAVRALLGGAD